jgi:hypothetical protein
VRACRFGANFARDFGAQFWSRDFGAQFWARDFGAHARACVSPWRSSIDEIAIEVRPAGAAVQVTQQTGLPTMPES